MDTWTPGKWDLFHEQSVLRIHEEKWDLSHLHSAQPASNGLAEHAVRWSEEDGGPLTCHQTFSFLDSVSDNPSHHHQPVPSRDADGEKAQIALGSSASRLRARVRHKQEKQKERKDQLAKERYFKPGYCVYIKNFAGGSPQLPGVINRQIGPVSFVLDLSYCQQAHRHQDHMRNHQKSGVEGLQSAPHEGPQSISQGDSVLLQEYTEGCSRQTVSSDPTSNLNSSGQPALESADTDG